MPAFVAHVLVLATLTTLSSGDGFEYGHQKNWGGSCRVNNGQQSPINIISPENTVVVKQPLVVPATSKDVNMTVAKDEHSVKLEFPVESGQFQFVIPTTDNIKTTALQVHLHWGWSEHLVDYKRFELECHLVTVRQEVEEEKLTVFARLFKLGERNPAIERFIAAVETGASYVEDFDLTQLYPDTIRHVFTYSGSLTTPPCTEGVSWFVVQDLLTVSQAQVDRLKALGFGSDAHKLLSNYRFIQSVNNRTITRYDLTSRAAHTTPTSLILHLTLLALCCLAY